MKKFTVTKEHLLLLKNTRVTWWHCEFGAPAIDCKRPYGNSDVISDIAELLGIEKLEGDDEWIWPKSTIERCEKLHKEIETALQIALRTGKFEEGTYIADEYNANWKKEK